jgi:hypothetical protein
MARHGRGVRHPAGGVDRLCVPVRAVRLASGQGGRGQLLHQARLCRAWPSARRAGQGRRGGQRDDRRDLGLVDRQCGHHRHLHHPADEAGGLHRRTGRLGRGRVLGQRSDHAAGDGRGRLPDGRVHRHPLSRGDQARLHPGGDLLHRAGLYRASGGAEEGHASTWRSQELCRNDLEVSGRLCRGGRGLHRADLWGRCAARRGARADRPGDAGGPLGPLCRAGGGRRPPPGSGGRRPERRKDRAAHGERGLCHRVALHPAHRRAGLVPDGRTPKPGEIGLLRHVADAVHHRHPAPAEGVDARPGRRAGVRVHGRACRSARGADRRARAT